ncbi:MAG: tetraacyldisaccharide 4'-kinase, partial [Acidobacteria bacterium]|nr:tetraacyldisaccharide 4'-kinase [Acidobacteriota bacterium]
ETAEFFERSLCAANYKSHVKTREINERIKINGSKSENLKSVAENRKSKFLAFCGLGNPRGFFEQLRGENFNLAATEIFRDHYFYRQSDVEKLEEAARKTGADALLTTAKDAVKLSDLRFKLPCFVAESEIVFAGGNDFYDWLSAKLEDARKRV